MPLFLRFTNEDKKMNVKEIDEMLNNGDLRLIDESDLKWSLGRLMSLLKDTDKAISNQNIKTYMKAIRAPLALYLFSQIPYLARVHKRLVLVLYFQLLLQFATVGLLVCAIFSLFGVTYVYPVAVALVWWVVNGTLQTSLNLKLASALYLCSLIYDNENGLLVSVEA